MVGCTGHHVPLSGWSRFVLKAHKPSAGIVRLEESYNAVEISHSQLQMDVARYSLGANTNLGDLLDLTQHNNQMEQKVKFTLKTDEYHKKYRSWSLLNFYCKSLMLNCARNDVVEKVLFFQIFLWQWLYYRIKSNLPLLFPALSV